MAEERRVKSSPMIDAGSTSDAVASIFEKSANAWLTAHEEALAGVQSIMADWLERRREEIDASRRAIERMRDCRDVSAFLRIQQDWLGERLQRTTSDFSAINDRVAEAARRTTAQFEDAIRTVSEVSRLANGAMLEAAGSKPVRRSRR